MKNMILSALCILITSSAMAYDLSATRTRFDGILIGVTPTYREMGQLWVTLNSNLCYGKGTPTPLADQPAFLQVPININMYVPEFSSYFDKDAPEGVDLCYVLTGRGQLESSVWGKRATNVAVPPPATTTDVPEMTASKDRTDGIEIKVQPRLNDFSELYVTPDQETCPVVGKPFNFQGRWAKAMDKLYNGYYAIDKSAAYEVDLCYFLISKRTNLVVATAWGYRKI